MAIFSNDDVYSETFLIIELLKSHGEDNLSQELSDAMSGFTSGELLGDIAVCMEKLSKNYVLLKSIKKEDEVKDILRYIKSVWNS